MKKLSFSLQQRKPLFPTLLAVFLALQAGSILVSDERKEEKDIFFPSHETSLETTVSQIEPPIYFFPSLSNIMTTPLSPNAFNFDSPSCPMIELEDYISQKYFCLSPKKQINFSQNLAIENIFLEKTLPFLKTMSMFSRNPKIEESVLPKTSALSTHFASFNEKNLSDSQNVKVLTQTSEAEVELVTDFSSSEITAKLKPSRDLLVSENTFDLISSPLIFSIDQENQNPVFSSYQLSCEEKTKPLFDKEGYYFFYSHDTPSFASPHLNTIAKTSGAPLYTHLLSPVKKTLPYQSHFGFHFFQTIQPLDLSPLCLENDEFLFEPLKESVETLTYDSSFPLLQPLSQLSTDTNIFFKASFKCISIPLSTFFHQKKSLLLESHLATTLPKQFPFLIDFTDSDITPAPGIFPEKENRLDRNQKGVLLGKKELFKDHHAISSFPESDSFHYPSDELPILSDNWVPSKSPLAHELKADQKQLFSFAFIDSPPSLMSEREGAYKHPFLPQPEPSHVAFNALITPFIPCKDVKDFSFQKDSPFFVISLEDPLSLLNSSSLLLRKSLTAHANLWAIAQTLPLNSSIILETSPTFLSPSEENCFSLSISKPDTMQPTCISPSSYELSLKDHVPTATLKTFTSLIPSKITTQPATSLPFISPSWLEEAGDVHASSSMAAAIKPHQERILLNKEQLSEKRASLKTENLFTKEKSVLAFSLEDPAIPMPFSSDARLMQKDQNKHLSRALSLSLFSQLSLLPAQDFSSKQDPDQVFPNKEKTDVKLPKQAEIKSPKWRHHPTSTLPAFKQNEMLVALKHLEWDIEKQPLESFEVLPSPSLPWISEKRAVTNKPSFDVLTPPQRALHTLAKQDSFPMMEFFLTQPQAPHMEQFFSKSLFAKKADRVKEVETASITSHAKEIAQRLQEETLIRSKAIEMAASSIAKGLTDKDLHTINETNRFTEGYLSSLPYPTHLETLSLSQAFDVKVSYVCKENGKGYDFAIKMKPREELYLASPEQNFIFLVDGSGSIKKQRYNTFKEAISRSLPYMRDGDSFNILVADSQIVSMGQTPVAYSKQAVKEAKTYLDSRPYRGYFANYDAFQILSQASKYFDSNKENVVIFLTDGHSLETLTKHREEFKKLMQINQGRFSLFTACASQGNHFTMLDLISTFNGGEMMYSPTNTAFPRKLAVLVKHIESCIAKDLRVTVTASRGEADIQFYPNQEALPFLYADREYTLYGSTDKLEDFALILQGKAGDEWLNIKQHISFRNAEKAGAKLKRNFALQQAYVCYDYYLKKDDPFFLAEAEKLLAPHLIPSATQPGL